MKALRKRILPLALGDTDMKNPFRPGCSLKLRRAVHQSGATYSMKLLVLLRKS